MSEHEQDKGFKVVDRRRFDETGEARADDAIPPGAARTADEALKSGPVGPDPELEPTPIGAVPNDVPIDFTSFVFSLGSSALMHLGESPHPETGLVHRELELAKETIDLLAMLQQKTQGNLSPEEERFLSSLLYDLRLRFVEASKAP